MAAARAFREEYVVSPLLEDTSFDDPDARLLRYEVLWASYENTAYRDIHAWARGLRTRYGLYKYIRNIYNPSTRLADFYVSTIWGGRLDPLAGETGAIPIKVGPKAPETALRGAIAQVWRDSNWSIKKTVATLWGAALGDLAIKVVDDTTAGQVRMELVHPGALAEVDFDARMFVRGYVIEEKRPDPRENARDGASVTYREEAWRGSGETVNYRTYLDGQPFAWYSASSSWSIDYGFIPLVAIQHRNVGGTWGWAEAHPGRSKIAELDDIASMLHDQMRKTVNPQWLFNFSKPRSGAAQELTAGSLDNPQPGREEERAIYVNSPEARGQPLVMPLDIAGGLQTLASLTAELERDYPELQMDIWGSGGDPSGVAMGQARKRVENKVVDRRTSYDSGLIRAHHMAVAIGGMRRLSGFEGFDLTSYKAGRLDHEVAERPVFSETEGERLGIKTAFWKLVIEAAGQGIPPEVILDDLGWAKDRIDRFMARMMRNEATQDERDAAKAEDETRRGVEAFTAQEKARAQAQAQAQEPGSPGQTVKPGGNRPAGGGGRQELESPQ